MMGDDGLGDLGLEGLLEEDGDHEGHEHEGLEGLGADDNDGIQVATPAQAAEVTKRTQMPALWL